MSRYITSACIIQCYMSITKRQWFLKLSVDLLVIYHMVFTNFICSVPCFNVNTIKVVFIVDLWTTTVVILHMMKCLSSRSHSAFMTYQRVYIHVTRLTRRCHLWSRNCLTFRNIWVHPRDFSGDRVTRSLAL